MVITVPPVIRRSTFSWAGMGGAAERKMKRAKAPQANADEHR
jgi:hypothetical protein